MKTLVVIPTYNEAKNIETLTHTIFKYLPQVEILVVDDNSPDSTAKLVKKLAKIYPRKIHLLLRHTRGRGSAGIDGFKWALKHQAKKVIEMDADFSHHPKYLPKMLKSLDKYDVVVGSRFVPGGKDQRDFLRTFITIIGAIYLRLILGSKLKDPTSGFRAFKSKVLQDINLDNFISNGTWAVVQETLYRAYLCKCKIIEIPIVFIDRERGVSKFNLWILLQSLAIAFILRLTFVIFKSGKGYNIYSNDQG